MSVDKTIINYFKSVIINVNRNLYERSKGNIKESKPMLSSQDIDGIIKNWLIRELKEKSPFFLSRHDKTEVYRMNDTLVLNNLKINHKLMKDYISLEWFRFDYSYSAYKIEADYLNDYLRRVDFVSLANSELNRIDFTSIENFSFEIKF